ncbi:MAG: hypothetical protein COS41_06750 [Elusimicrobia bacterium CG03_land_8_20_14_0_80_50_18]|nr:MAG: hypothetical protein COS41_06750 [Elusimicrobia bacterium CG03_land_8_20_14_0_80_50_18]
MKKISFGIFAKFLSALAVISLVPLFLTGLRLININRVTLKRMVMEKHISAASLASYKVDSYFDSLSKSLLLITNARTLGSLSGEQLPQTLRALISSSRSIASAALVSCAGREESKFYNPALTRETPPSDYSRKEEFISAREGKPAAGKPYVSAGGLRINAAYPAGEKILFITASLDELFSEIKNTVVGRSGQLMLVDSEGRILTSRADAFGTVLAHPLIGDFISSRVTAARDFVLAGKKMSGAYAPVMTMGWAVIVEEPYEDAYYSLFLMKRNAVLSLLAVAITALLMAFFAAKSMTKPITELTAAASGIAGGDFSKGVKVSSGDEIGELADTFNRMSVRLKEYNEMQIDRIVAEKTKTKAVIFSIFDGLILTDYDGKILLANSQAERILGLSGLEEGNNIADYVEDSGSGLKEFFKEVSANSGKNIVKEFSFDPDRGGATFAKAQTAPVLTESGAALGTVTVFRDISIEKKLDAMKEFFMQAIAHDLRNPLSSISGFIDIMTMQNADSLSAKQKHCLAVMEKETRRLQSMINDILDAARLEAGKMTPLIRSVPVNFLASNAIEGLSGMALQKGVELKSELPPESPRLNADGELIQRVIVNLLANAVKFTPQGGEVTLEVSRRESSVRVEVRDTGQGMPKEACEKIFEKFHRIPGALAGGTGIGLTISREIVKAHSGRIWAESELGKGSNFIFEIPDGLPQSEREC